MPQKTRPIVTGVEEAAQGPKQMLTKAEYVQNMTMGSATYFVAGKQNYHHPTPERMLSQVLLPLPLIKNCIPIHFKKLYNAIISDSQISSF